MVSNMVFSAISGDDIISKLVPNWVNFVVQLAAFLILAVIVIFVAYKPVKKMIKNRQDYIDENIKQSEIAKSRAHDNAIKSEVTLTESHKQANEIIEKAKLDAEIEKNRILEEASLEVNKMKNDVLNDIEQSKIDAKEDIRKEMVNLALDATSELLSRNINDKDNEKLAEQFIKSLEEK